MKQQFFDYLGDINDLAGYQRSYKLVFYKCFFERQPFTPTMPAYTMSTAFKQFYVNRIEAGFTPDVNVDPVIADAQNASPKSVFSLILRNPFNAISSKGFFVRENVDGKEHFSLNEELARELDDQDVHQIVSIVNAKLDYYYSRMTDDLGEGQLKSVIEKFINEYEAAKKETFAQHPFGSFVRNTIPKTIYTTGLVDEAKYLITASVGQGNWATVPWICIFDRSITTTATKGVYIVYLLSKDTNTLYLTFNQGCTDIRSNHSKRETIAIMREKASEIISAIDARGFNTDEEIDLGSGLTELAELYQKGTIFYKAYQKGNVPSDTELKDDLQKMMDIYSEYAEPKEVSPDEWWPPEKEYHPGISTEQWVSLLQDENIFKPNSLAIMAEFFNEGGQATCALLASKYGNGKSPSFYIMTCVHLAERVIKATGCPRIEGEANSRYWPVLFVGKGAGSDQKGIYIWKLRRELHAALEQVDILRFLPGGEEEVEELNIADKLSRVKSFIYVRGFDYPDGLIENFYLSLKSKPFVILAGTSGTGKTRLVKLFAEAIGAEFRLVSVRPDWSDGSDLFGHADLNGNFIPGPVCDAFDTARENPDKPVFLCLDEMNLARVEYYLSDFLSVIESRERFEGQIVTDAIAQYADGIPDNLYIIGTVNMDETTFPFSKKVLDRANTIEFSCVDLMPQPRTGEILFPQELPNSFLRTEYLVLSLDCMHEWEYMNSICAELKAINEVLVQANAHVGYRVRDEIVFYLLNNKNAGNLLAHEQAMDNEIMQKILPRIQGSSAAVKNMLCELFKICAGDYEGIQTESDNASAKMLKASHAPDCKYPKSAKKIAFMVRRYEEDGFTSYWL